MSASTPTKMRKSDSLDSVDMLESPLQKTGKFGIETYVVKIEEQPEGDSLNAEEEEGQIVPFDENSPLEVFGNSVELHHPYEKPSLTPYQRTQQALMQIPVKEVEMNTNNIEFDEDRQQVRVQFDAYYETKDFLAASQKQIDLVQMN